MEYHIDKECSALGGLFQTIINDMKTQSPVWDDFINKATKLHSTLRATILATGAFLDAFQRVADMATNTRGATRDIGSALTRLCMRHRSIENKLKVFTSSIVDLCVNPLQERMEEWKKTVIQLDKDHAKEYKKARNEIKKASSDTMRLQKKVRKGKNDMQNRLDSALQDVGDKFMMLEETEKNAVRTALIEERSRFCLFISCLKPVVDEEIAMLSEITHLQEVIDSLCMQAGDPFNLPAASEQVILDLKASDNHAWSFQTPPSSPTSIGSRKSSMCSISSMTSSSSGSTKSHSPSHHFRHRASSQILEVQLNSKPPTPGTVRLSSVSSQDSGFTSQDTLFLKTSTPPLELDAKNSLHETSSGTSTGTDSNASTPSPSHYPGPPLTSASTWSNWPDPPHHPAKPDPTGLPFERPHTISTAYERHARPALTSQTFEPPDPVTIERPNSLTVPPTPSMYAVPTLIEHPDGPRDPVGQSPYAVPCIVPQTKRDSKVLEGPGSRLPPPAPGPKPRMKVVAPPVVPDFNSNQPDQSKKMNVYLPSVIPQPVYVNMNELATMAVAKQKEVEEHRRQQQQLLQLQCAEGADGSQAETGQQVQKAAEPSQQKSPSPYAKPSLGRCHRSISMPSQSADSRELADAIKELEASTAALTMVYDGGTAGARHSVAGYTSIPGVTIEDGPGMPPGSAGPLRRGSLPAKPAAPVRRTSSISGGMVVVPPPIPGPPEGYEGTGDRSGSKTPTPQGTPTQHRRALSEVGGIVMGQPLGGSDGEEGAWPPLPPDHLIGAQEADSVSCSSASSSSTRLSIGSITDSHANIIHSLNTKFASGAMHPAPPPGAQMWYPDYLPLSGSVCSQTHERALSQSSDDVTPTAETPSENFLLQIHRGVSLRRTQSNDRSAPKLP